MYKNRQTGVNRNKGEGGWGDDWRLVFIIQHNYNTSHTVRTESLVSSDVAATFSVVVVLKLVLL